MGKLGVAPLAATRVLEQQQTPNTANNSKQIELSLKKNGLRHLLLAKGQMIQLLIIQGPSAWDIFPLIFWLFLWAFNTSKEKKGLRKWGKFHSVNFIPSKKALKNKTNINRITS